MNGIARRWQACSRLVTPWTGLFRDPVSTPRVATPPVPVPTGPRSPAGGTEARRPRPPRVDVLGISWGAGWPAVRVTQRFRCRVWCGATADRIVMWPLTPGLPTCTPGRYTDPLRTPRPRPPVRRHRPHRPRTGRTPAHQGSHRYTYQRSPAWLDQPALLTPDQTTHLVLAGDDDPIIPWNSQSSTSFPTPNATFTQGPPELVLRPRPDRAVVEHFWPDNHTGNTRPEARARLARA